MRALTTALIAILLTSALARDAHAQRSLNVDPGLLRIDSLIAAGSIAQARDSIARWNASHPRTDTSVSGDSRAFALLLTGKLAREWREAERAFQTVALTWPVSAFAPEALLRLGQGLVAQATTPQPGNAADRAAGYLERLINDYPIAPQRGAAFYWAAQAYLLTDRRPLACARLRTATTIALDSVTAELTRSLHARACA